tara:strand:+ start:2288 stop:3340 length:1053 start_codon:yes stop_codon:yes gene_type:complete
MDPNSISDIRDNFKNISFSGYQKSRVKKELIDCIYNCKIENSCYWSVELICAGHYSELWDIIIYYMSKYVHISNPKLPIYLKMRFDIFIDIVNNGFNNNILELRNNKKIRDLFCECICVLCYSKKTHSYEGIKINTDEEFILTNIENKLIAPSIEYGNHFFKDDDPKQLLIPINELAYSIIKKNTINSCYWVEWIIEYENLCKKKKIKLSANRRDFATNDYQKDIIWIVWELLLDFSSFYSKMSNKIIKSLLELFKIKYSISTKKKRKHIIYFAISLLTENIDYEIPISEKKDMIENIMKKINSIYLQVKKNETSPKTDYLFNGVEKSNLNKTIERLDIMNNIYENIDDN